MTKENLVIRNGIQKSKNKTSLQNHRNKKQNIKRKKHIHRIEQHSSVFQLEKQNFDCEMIDDGETFENEIEDDCYFEESIDDLEFIENIFSNSVHFDEKNSEDGVPPIIVVVK